MRNNIGYIDKTLRMLVVFIICGLVFSKLIVGVAALVLFLLAIILTQTCFKGSCPLYRLFRINTRRNLNDKAKIHERNQALLRNVNNNYRDSNSNPQKVIN